MLITIQRVRDIIIRFNVDKLEGLKKLMDSMIMVQKRNPNNHQGYLAMD